MLSLTSEERTFWHGLRASHKLLAMLMVSVVLFVFSGLWVQVAAFLIAQLFWLMGGLGFFREGMRNLLRIWPVAVFIAVWHGITGEYATGVALLLRLAAVVALANLVTMTTALKDMIDVLHWLATPVRKLGITTRPAEIALAMVIRFIPVLHEKSDTLRESWQARSVKRAGWRIITPIAVLAIDDAEQLSEALRARGGLIQPATED